MPPPRPTLYTVMGFRSLKVRFLAGLELYLHFDSTNLISASLATASDTVGTLEDQHTLTSPHRSPLVLREPLMNTRYIRVKSTDLTLGTEVFLLSSGWGL